MFGRFLALYLVLISGVDAGDAAASVSSFLSRIASDLAKIDPENCVSSVYVNLARNRMDPLCGDFKIESKVSDDYTVGANVDLHGNPLKSVFAKITTQVCGYSVDSDLTMDMSSNEISGDVTYSEGDHMVKELLASSTLDSVVYSRSGPGWVFKPSFNVRDNNIALDASYDCSAETSVVVSVGAPGHSTFTVNHVLDSTTSVKVGMDGTGASSTRFEVSHLLDSVDTVKPRYDMASKQLSLGWVRKLANGRTLDVDVDPGKAVGIVVTGNGEEDWVATASAPWGQLGGVPDVSISRKFNL